jgi:hypothetical protein
VPDGRRGEHELGRATADQPVDRLDVEDRNSGQTEVIPAVRPPDTLELPGVPAAADPAAADPAAADPDAADPDAADPAAAGPAAPRPAAPPRPPARPRSGRRALLVVVAVLAVAAVSLVGYRLGALDDPLSGAVAPGEPPIGVLPASASSFDPSGGSGVRTTASGTWRTQTYVTDRFGGLKPGVGLLLDLGAPHDVSTVSVPVVSDALTMELRSGDAGSESLGGFEKVGSAQTGTGTVTFSATSAGRHRYWLVWITRLAPRDNGFGAELRAPVLEG